MITVEKATRIAAPADKVWHLLSSEQGQRELEKGIIAAVKFEGKGVGMIRTLQLEGHSPQNEVKERLELCDEETMEMRLAIIDTGDVVPFACHSGYARVIPAGPRASILFLQTSFVPVGIDDETARATAEENHNIFTANVLEVVGRETGKS